MASWDDPISPVICADAEIGVGQLLAEGGVVAPLRHEVLVVVERVVEQVSAQSPDIDGILLAQ